MNHGCKNFKSNIKGMGSFIIQFNIGSNIECNGYYGISHIIEHCMCEPFKKYELDFEKYGINYNASTNFNFVNFYITGLDEGIIKFRKEFYDSIINFEIPKDIFERERNIVIQEYNDSLSKPINVFFENIFRKFFNIRFPIGEMKDLQNLTYEKFIEYKNKFFSKPTFIFNTSSVKINKEEFDTQYINIKINDTTGDKFKNCNKLPLVKGTVSDNSIYIGFMTKFKFNIDTLEEYLYNTLISNYLCYGLSSPLYKSLREETGHVYSVSSFIESPLEKGNAAFFIITLTEPKYEDEIKGKIISCLDYHLNNIDENIFKNVVLGFKNQKKREKLLSYMNNISFNSKISKTIEKYNFDFEKFKDYCKKLLKNDYIIFNNINY